MKTVIILLILSLTLSSCTVYKEKKIIERYPAKYEYRCVGEVCKEVNMNHVIGYIAKDKYKHLSEKELYNKQHKFNDIESNTVTIVGFGIPAITGVVTGINVGGGQQELLQV